MAHPLLAAAQLADFGALGGCAVAVAAEAAAAAAAAAGAPPPSPQAILAMLLAGGATCEGERGMRVTGAALLASLASLGCTGVHLEVSCCYSSCSGSGAGAGFLPCSEPPAAALAPAFFIPLTVTMPCFSCAAAVQRGGGAAPPCHVRGGGGRGPAAPELQQPLPPHLAAAFLSATLEGKLLDEKGTELRSVSHKEQYLVFVQYLRAIGAVGPAAAAAAAAQPLPVPLPAPPGPAAARAALAGPTVVAAAHYSNILTNSSAPLAPPFPLLPQAVPPGCGFVNQLVAATRSLSGRLCRDAATLNRAALEAAASAITPALRAPLGTAAALLSAATTPKELCEVFKGAPHMRAMLEALALGAAPPAAAAAGASHGYLIGDFFMAADAAALGELLAEAQRRTLRPPGPGTASAKAVLHAASLSIAGSGAVPAAEVPLALLLDLTAGAVAASAGLRGGAVAAAAAAAAGAAASPELQVELRHAQQGLVGLQAALESRVAQAAVLPADALAAAAAAVAAAAELTALTALPFPYALPAAAAPLPPPPSLAQFFTWAAPPRLT